MSDRVPPNRTMRGPIKAVYYAIVLLGNVVVNKIPSRHLRKWFYRMLGAKIGKGSYISRRTEVLFPKGLDIADRVSIGWFAELDARGEISIGHDTNISSHTRMITGSHDVDDPKFTASFRPIRIGHHCWIATGATILSGVTIGNGSVVAAGAVVTRNIPEMEIWGGSPAKCLRKRGGSLDYQVSGVAPLH